MVWKEIPSRRAVGNAVCHRSKNFELRGRLVVRGLRHCRRVTHQQAVLFAALAGGILILLMPRLLNYVVAIYLILVGAIGLNNIYHFIR